MVLSRLTRGGVEAVLWVGGGVAMAETSLLVRGQVGFGSSSVDAATGKERKGG